MGETTVKQKERIGGGGVGEIGTWDDKIRD